MWGRLLAHGLACDNELSHQFKFTPNPGSTFFVSFLWMCTTGGSWSGGVPATQQRPGMSSRLLVLSSLALAVVGEWTSGRETFLSVPFKKKCKIPSIVCLSFLHAEVHSFLLLSNVVLHAFATTYLSNFTGTQQLGYLKDFSIMNIGLWTFFQKKKKKSVKKKKEKKNSSISLLVCMWKITADYWGKNYLTFGIKHRRLSG